LRGLLSRRANCSKFDVDNDSLHQPRVVLRKLAQH
jgi:hypothetical protein